MILTLPTELQTEILSFLSLQDQMSALMVCPQWQTLLNTKTFTKTRYFDCPEDWRKSSFPRGLHRLLGDEEYGFLLSLVCRSSRGARARDNREALKYHYTARRVDIASLQQTDYSYQDITECPFLDDPLINPTLLEEKDIKVWMNRFCLRIFTNTSGEDTVDNIKRNELGKPLDKITVRELINSAVEKLTERGMPKEKAKVTFSYVGNEVVVFAFRTSTIV